VDLSVNRLLRFKEQAERLHICQMESDIAKVNCPSQSFDLIVCSEVIEHLPNYRHVLSEAFRLLKKDGFFMVTVPNNEKLKMLTCPHCLKVFYRDDHVNSFTQRSLAADLKQTGFHIVETLVLYSKIFNQIQYHLKLPYGILVKACDRVLSAIFKKYTFHLLIRAQK
jgi:2-polyprenyl-3-methyl-5-hydroxy-6-metoxy-1,4-benzoquinol methylase